MKISGHRTDRAYMQLTLLVSNLDHLFLLLAMLVLVVQILMDIFLQVIINRIKLRNLIINQEQLKYFLHQYLVVQILVQIIFIDMVL